MSCLPKQAKQKLKELMPSTNDMVIKNLKRPLKLGQTFTLLIHNAYTYYVYYEVELQYVEISFDTSLCMCILPISSVFVL